MAAARDYLSLIKFSHSVFALPFALIALLVVTAGAPGWTTLALVIAAMVCARTAAMAYNRFADRDIDARNPRTAGRELPSGKIRPGNALALTLAASAGFVASAFALAPLCGWLALPVLAVLLGYSHAKRFTALSHAWLGLALGLAPPAATLAARGTLVSGTLDAALLGVAVLVWVAGFDVLYACQDIEFDRNNGLHSLPARLGAATAMRVAQLAHLLAAALFVVYGVRAGLGWGYGVAVALAIAFLVYEHRLLAPHDLRRIDMAFFTMNGLVGISLLLGTLVDLYC